MSEGQRGSAIRSFVGNLHGDSTRVSDRRVSLPSSPLAPSTPTPSPRGPRSPSSYIILPGCRAPSFFPRVVLSSLPFLSVRYTFVLTTVYHPAIILQTSPCRRSSPFARRRSILPTLSLSLGRFLAVPLCFPFGVFRSLSRPARLPLRCSSAGSYRTGFCKIYVCRRVSGGATAGYLFFQ